MFATVPIFPLGTVLMPGAPLPLHIFEPRYRQLTVDLVTGTVPDKEFGVIAIREGFDVDTHGMAALEPVGCTARLLDVRRLPDGRFDIVTVGARRFRLHDIDDNVAAYLRGKIEFVPDADNDPASNDLVRMLVHAARAAHRAYCVAAWKGDQWSEPAKDTAPAELAALLAADCLLPLRDRQAMLEETCPAERLRMVRALIVRETALLRRLHAVPAALSSYAETPSLN